MKILPQSNKQRFKNELGVQAPTGFWDPAGFTADGSVEDFKRRRQTELKHGRISMLATMGYITPEHLGKKVKIGYVKQGLSLANKKIFHSAIVRNALLLVCEVAFCNQEMESLFPTCQGCQIINFPFSFSFSSASTASSRWQCSPPHLNRKLPMAVFCTGPQLSAPDSRSRWQCSSPDLNCQLPIPAPDGSVPHRTSTCQNLCQIDRMSEFSSNRM